MIVTVDKLCTGISRYLEQDLAPVITDKAFQFAVIFLSEMIKQSNQIVEQYLRQQPMLNILVPWDENSKGYDISKLMSALKNSLTKCAVLPITIPAILGISGEPKEIKFTASDIDRIEQYLK